jgi:hypothetical protein
MDKNEKKKNDKLTMKKKAPQNDPKNKQGVLNSDGTVTKGGQKAKKHYE